MFQLRISCSITLVHNHCESIIMSGVVQLSGCDNLFFFVVCALLGVAEYGISGVGSQMQQARRLLIGCALRAVK